MHQKDITSNFVGKAGECAVASQLLRRKIHVNPPMVDDGADFIVGGKLRVQVKTASTSTARPSGYGFGLGNKRLGKYQKTRYFRDWVGVVDFLICVGLGKDKAPDRFWIFPASAMQKYPKVQTLLLGANTRRCTVDHQKLEKLIKSGMRQCDVAREMGIHPVTVSEHVRGNRPLKKKLINVLAEDADRYESAWHEIEQALKLAQEIDNIDPVELLGEAEREHTERNLAGQSFTNEESD